MSEKFQTGNTALTCATELMSSHPSDEIILTNTGAKHILDFREEVMKDNTSDITSIMFANTVPLMDFIMVNSNGDRVRFCIFENALKELPETPMGSTTLVGCMELYDKEPHSVVMFGLIKEKSRFVFSNEVINIFGKQVGYIDPDKGIAIYSDAMYLWHAVQIALLHPYEKEIFANPTKHKIYTREKDDKGKRKRVVRYIRRHVIDSGAVAHINAKRTRHCMVWYVIGHWRHYKSGKVVYIHPYWKGEMRSVKMNLDGNRNRKVEIENGDQKE